MSSTPVKTERFTINFAHDEGNACARQTARILECEVDSGTPRINISTWGDPGLKHCQFCDKPLTRVASFTPAHKSAV